MGTRSLRTTMLRSRHRSRFATTHSSAKRAGVSSRTENCFKGDGMGIDRYTKAMLTLIALSLLFLCVRPYFNPQPVSAQGGSASPQEVKIVGIADSTEIPVRLV